jgi:hypothetical protein
VRPSSSSGDSFDDQHPESGEADVVELSAQPSVPRESHYDSSKVAVHRSISALGRLRNRDAADTSESVTSLFDLPLDETVITGNLRL